MEIKLKHIKIRDLVKGYANTDGGGVVAYDGKLDVRPKYQREFVYKYEQQVAVIDTVMKGFPLNVMYWVDRGDGSYEVLDGQQRTLSICEFHSNRLLVEKVFNEPKNFYTLQADERDRFLDYELTVYFCSGTDSEKIDWFRTINIAGERLTEQELRNAVYAGPWVTDAKGWFSRVNGPAKSKAGDYLTGTANRQEYLETAIKWHAKAKTDEEICAYMALHASEPNANQLWQYFDAVISWVESTFKHTSDRKKLMKGQNWGMLYDMFHAKTLDVQKIEKRIQELLLDPEVDNKKGIYTYVLTGEERNLNLRAFDESMKMAAYEKQGGICAKCQKPFPFEEMEGDHIVPWSKGGKTAPDNLQMLCRRCNGMKSDK